MGANKYETFYSKKSTTELLEYLNLHKTSRARLDPVLASALEEHLRNRVLSNEENAKFEEILLLYFDEPSAFGEKPTNDEPSVTGEKPTNDEPSGFGEKPANRDNKSTNQRVGYRTAVFIGALAGIPLSYWLQSAQMRHYLSLSEYLDKLTDLPDKTSSNIFISCALFAGVGALIIFFRNKKQIKPLV